MSDESPVKHVITCTPHFQRIRQMMGGFGQDTPDRPEIPDAKTRELRCRLILEEALEFVEAAGFTTYMAAGGGIYHPISFKDLSFESTSKPDLELMVDGLADISVVTIGSFVALGVADEAVLLEVDKNNLLKIATGHKDPETGKFIKAPDHPLPDIQGVLDTQKQGSLTTG